MIYADNAATTKLLPSAFVAMKPFLLDEYANVSQPYAFSKKAKKALKEARKIIADCIGAFPEEIYFTSSGTESDNWALKGVVLNDNTPKTIITSKIEHKAVLNSCLALERLGHKVIYLPVNRVGKVLLEKTPSVSLMADSSPTSSGGASSRRYPQVGALDNSHHTSLTTHHAEALASANNSLISNLSPLFSKKVDLPPNLTNTLNDGYSSKPVIISIMMANNEVGTIQPIKELCEIAHKNGAIFHTDAVQAVGHIKFDVHELGVDLLSASAHKFNGPKGVGFLYIKKGTKIYPLNDGGAQEFGLRGGTENVAGVVGMATALKYNAENIDTNISKLKTFEEIIIKKLTEAKIDFIRNGSNNRIPGNISLSFKNSEGEMLLHRLDLMGICVSTGSACDSKNTQISHVLKAMNIPEEYAKGTIRISLGHNNTESEAKNIAEALIRILMQ